MRSRLALATAALFTVASCGDDDAPGADADTAVDAAVDPDADRDADTGLCPGQIAFEAAVVDRTTGEPVPSQVTVAEIGTENESDAAPNGRALICLDGDAQLSFTADGYFERVHVVDADVARAQIETGEPTPIELYTGDAVEALLAEAGLVRDPGDALVLIEARGYPDGAPLAGVGLALDTAHDGSFDLGGEPGAVTGDSGALFFANATPAPAATLEVTPPGDLGCRAPGALALEGDVVVSTLVGCR